MEREPRTTISVTVSTRERIGELGRRFAPDIAARYGKINLDTILRYLLDLAEECRGSREGR